MSTLVNKRRGPETRPGLSSVLILCPLEGVSPGHPTGPLLGVGDPDHPLFGSCTSWRYPDQRDDLLISSVASWSLGLYPRGEVSPVLPPEVSGTPGELPPLLHEPPVTGDVPPEPVAPTLAPPPYPTPPTDPGVVLPLDPAVLPPVRPQVVGPPTPSLSIVPSTPPPPASARQAP